jgi:formylglycine-generating enzyme required for sulfatase activity
MDQGLATGKPEGARRWYVTGQRQTMVVILPPGEVWTGEGEKRRRQLIDYRFAVAAHEVTVEQFRRFREQFQPDRNNAPTDDCPVQKVSWLEAAAYCNWLSRKEGIPEDQWCYVSEDKGKPAAALRPAPDYRARTGYRLPDEAEWEFACRAGAVTRLCCGEADDALAGRYAWCFVNSFADSSRHTHPVGSLKPNDLGLFDVHGNVSEWCQDAAPARLKDGVLVWKEGGGEGADEVLHRVLRGGSFVDVPALLNAGTRSLFPPGYVSVAVGFRPARTLR